MLEVPAPAGVLRLPIVGIMQGFLEPVWHHFYRPRSLPEVMERRRRRCFPYLSDARRGRRRGAQRRILDQFSHERRLFVLSNAAVRSYVLKVTDQWFGMTYLQLFVAVLVAILGIVNTLTVSITDRRRELGVLRAVGGLRNQIRHTIWLEAIAIGIIGLVLGLGGRRAQPLLHADCVAPEFRGDRARLHLPIWHCGDPDPDYFRYPHSARPCFRRRARCAVP